MSRGSRGARAASSPGNELPAAGVHVKICGVCRASDAEVSLAAGADYVGVIVHGPGPRMQGVAGAAAIFAAVPAHRRVGVFVDGELDEVLEAARLLDLAVVQLHGGEAPAYVAAVAGAGVRVWKAGHPANADEYDEFVREFAGTAEALLLDGGSAGQPGGSGRRFDWRAIAARRAGPVPPLIAAGGLDAANVADAVKLLAPVGVDVSSGVEEAVGRKSAAKVRAFVQAAKRAASDLEQEKKR
jgi:phosphoribosylanthranilate isomerase